MAAPAPEQNILIAVSVVIAAKRPNIVNISFLNLVNTRFNDQHSSKRYRKTCCKEYHLHAVHLLYEIVKRHLLFM